MHVVIVKNSYKNSYSRKKDSNLLIGCKKRYERQLISHIQQKAKKRL